MTGAVEPEPAQAPPAGSAAQARESQSAPQPPAKARYVAIITDGNGRWARAHGVPVNAGHDAGADTVKARLRDAVDLGVKELTVYSFSTENWSRPAAEVQGLMEMFSRRIAGETPELHEEGVRMRFIGRRAGITAELVQQMRWAEALTDANSRITLFVAFNYGGRAEILDAALRFAEARATQRDGQEGYEGQAGQEGYEGQASQEANAPGAGGPLPAELAEEDFRRCLYAPEMHDPDLIIRTSGERRLSNYLLWQGAYSELVFRDELWPDFSREALEESLAEFTARRRRFGGR
jgi:undecaprenyl diphosphate synthase